jgi:hypothetical protein
LTEAWTSPAGQPHFDPSLKDGWVATISLCFGRAGRGADEHAAVGNTLPVWPVGMALDRVWGFQNPTRIGYQFSIPNLAQTRTQTRSGPGLTRPGRCMVLFGEKVPFIHTSRI